MTTPTSTVLYKKIDQSVNIDQGDIFLNFPLLLPSKDIKLKELYEIKDGSRTDVEFDVFDANIIILTQSCDMVNDTKINRFPIDPVIVAVINDISKYSSTLVQDTNSGRKPAYYLLNKNEGFLEHSHIIDFTKIFTVPYELLSNFSKTHGDRIRPISPILEKISQHFGNYFSRIGLEYERNSKDLREEYDKLKEQKVQKEQ